MCFGGSPPKPPPIPKTSVEQEIAVRQAEDNMRRRRAQAAGRASTLLTGGQGVPGNKTLLGQ